MYYVINIWTEDDAFRKAKLFTVAAQILLHTISMPILNNVVIEFPLFFSKLKFDFVRCACALCNATNVCVCCAYVILTGHENNCSMNSYRLQLKMKTTEQLAVLTNNSRLFVCFFFITAYWNEYVWVIDQWLIRLINAPKLQLKASMPITNHSYKYDWFLCIVISDIKGASLTFGLNYNSFRVTFRHSVRQINWITMRLINLKYERITMHKIYS